MVCNKPESTLSNSSLRMESVKRFISHFVTNNESLLVLTFIDLEMENDIRYQHLKSWHLFCYQKNLSEYDQ